METTSRFGPIHRSHRAGICAAAIEPTRSFHHRIRDRLHAGWIQVEELDQVGGDPGGDTDDRFDARIEPARQRPDEPAMPEVACGSELAESVLRSVMMIGAGTRATARARSAARLAPVTAESTKAGRRRRRYLARGIVAAHNRLTPSWTTSMCDGSHASFGPPPAARTTSMSYP